MHFIMVNVKKVLKLILRVVNVNSCCIFDPTNKNKQYGNYKRTKWNFNNI